MSAASEASLIIGKMTLRGGGSEELMTALYDELRALAARYLAAQRRDHTLQPTALVHEAYLRLLGQTAGVWTDKNHFFSVAAMAMRQILVNHAERRNTQKRGGGMNRILLDDVAQNLDAQTIDLVALNSAMLELEQFDERQARIVEMRYFGGMDVAEVAEVLNVSTSTIEKDWRMARGWLLRRLSA